MNAHELRASDYVAHMLEAIERIRSYTADLDDAAFRNAAMVQDAVIRNIEILGEACRHIMRQSPDFLVSNADIPWQDIYMMRNRVAHGYFTVNLATVWEVIRRDLPQLRSQLQALQDRLGTAP